MASYTSSSHSSNTYADDLFTIFSGTAASEQPLETSPEDETQVLFGAPVLPFLAAHQSVNSRVRLTPQPWSVQSLSSRDSRDLTPTSERDLVMDNTLGPFTPETAVSSPHFSQVVPPLWPGHDGLQDLQLASEYPINAAAMAGFRPQDEIEGDQPPHIKNEEPGLDLYAQTDDQAEGLYNLALGANIDPSLPLAGQSQMAASPLRADSTFPGAARLPLPSQYLPPDNTIYKTEHPHPFIPIISLSSAKRRNAKARHDSKQATRHRRASASTTITSPNLIRASTSTATFSFSPPSSSLTPRPYKCSELNCPDSYPTPYLLQNHMNTCHRRPFKCIFNYASCPATFTKKNEWKRHVKTQHLVTEYWHCTTGHCRQVQPLHARNSTTRNRLDPRGSVFKRKDLFTQHVRRMHLDANSVDKTEEERKLNGLLDNAKRTRCTTPLYMSCPVVGCDKYFRGKKAWEERMEHVAVHLEAAENEKEDEVVFGSVDDPTLATWAESGEVDIVRKGEDGELQCWDPLKGCALTQTLKE